MATRLQDKKTDLLERVADRVHDKLDRPLAALAEAFVQHYYRAVPPDDLAERDPLDLYGAALAHLRFGEHRRPGQAKVRVYNPKIEQHGWQSTHTVVEIVNDDMPFLVDSVSMALNRLGLVIHLMIHPVLPVRRDADGRLEAVLDAASGDGGEPDVRIFMLFEVDRQSDPERLDAIRAELERRRSATCAPRSRTGGDARQDRARRSPSSSAAPGARCRRSSPRREAFLALDRRQPLHLARLRLLRPDPRPGRRQLRRVKGTALGLLRRQADRRARPRAASPRCRRRCAAGRAMPAPLLITKANTRSTVHRPVYLDFIGVKRFDAKGNVIGEHRFLGLFTSAAYNRNPRQIPLLRRKVERVIERADLPPAGHAGKALANILETYPRDELFQTGEDELFEIAQGILHLQDRQPLRLFVRRDPSPASSPASSSCRATATTPRSGASSRTSCWQALGGTESEFQAQLSESILARILFIVRTPDGIPADSIRASSSAAWSRPRAPGPIGCATP